MLCVPPLTLSGARPGLRLCEYVDTTGHPTICYGFNLDAAGASSKVAAVGGNYQDLLKGGCLDQSQCAQLLSGAVASATEGASRIFGDQCSCVQAALIDMTYNLGDAGMATFTTFISEIKAHEWSAAAEDARNTLWCSQVGTRCTRDSDIIAAGCSGDVATGNLRGASDETVPMLKMWEASKN